MLNEFAVVSRYPGDYEEFDIAESKKAFQIAKNTFDKVKEILL